MEIIRTTAWMKQVARDARVNERILGLVPTMGALHEGHLSLVREAQKRCSPVVVSIFVNPTQFGPNEDFKKYPRTFEADQAALENLRVDYIFAPPPEEIYPPGFRTSVAVEGLGDALEGRVRPGHFRGVTTVVLKLFQIAQPRFAFFGRKDAQQARIIRQMAADLNLDAEIVVCPIVREADGLALSSRNAYLKGGERQSATGLYRSLDVVRQEIAKGERDAARLIAAMRATVVAEPVLALDYAEIVDGATLEPVVSLRKTCYALVAARVGATRLIDNALIEQEGDFFRVTL
ncbi:MAG TPA: pantoate--beta-alanine ligase [Candidatus Acidoferrales bacterium]|jgi:pantoate--beta-alanine ligase|nr:pantoate--beta-alanine ligase [Candidatus Acidoferrales bacterium]